MKQTCFLSKQNDSPGSFRHDIRLGNRQLALSWSILAEPLESILFFISYMLAGNSGPCCSRAGPAIINKNTDFTVL